MNNKCHICGEEPLKYGLCECIECDKPTCPDCQWDGGTHFICLDCYRSPFYCKKCDKEFTYLDYDEGVKCCGGELCYEE